jgi:hypothetical protein
MSVKTRLSPQEQLRIFTEGLKDNVKIAEICRREEYGLMSIIELRRRPFPELWRPLKILAREKMLKRKIYRRRQRG